MIFWIVPGVVNKLDLVILMFRSELEWAETSGRSGPGFGWNWSSRESAINSARSMAGKTRPLGPVRG